MPFLERLGDELTRPVVPKGAAIDYIPSQFLCEFIKKKGYDGVAYRSSISNGFNLALFMPSRARPLNCSMYSVENVNVSIELLN
ncbi:MAG: RES family NAD+ phosphorylase [Pseudomonadota bacterium]